MASPKSNTAYVYHDPSPSTTRSRRSSTIRSFTSPLSRTNSNQEMLRPGVPKRDGGDFAFNAEHLKHWNMDDEKLWGRLPAKLQMQLTAMQHAGAAVFSSLERLGEIQGFQTNALVFKVCNDDNIDHIEGLPSPKFRTIDNDDSIFKNGLPSPAYTGSPLSGSGCSTPAESLSFNSQDMTPFSPITLGPAAAELLEKGNTSRDRSFSIPREPRESYSAAELSCLRTEALPRLRHSARSVEIEWTEAKQAQLVSSGDIEAFENWWSEKKQVIVNVDDQGQRLASADGVTSTGLGWSAS